MCPFINYTHRGQYLAAFDYVRPVYVSKYPVFIFLRHVDLTGNPDAACIVCISASTLGRLYALYSDKVVCLLSVVWRSSNSFFGLRAKRHSFGIYFSLYPVRMGLPPGDNTVTS